MISFEGSSTSCSLSRLSLVPSLTKSRHELGPMGNVSLFCLSACLPSIIGAIGVDNNLSVPLKIHAWFGSNVLCQ